MILRVNLNGTKSNPFYVYGLRQNPFPQYAQYEYVDAMMAINSLGGDPIPNVEYIRETLRGFHPVFIDLVCKNFKLGEYVRLEIHIPDEALDMPPYREDKKS